MGLLTRSGRALGLGAGGFHWCGACQGSGRCAMRTWTSKGWQTSNGKCGMCSGKGGRFQNHDAIGKGAMRRMR